MQAMQTKSFPLAPVENPLAPYGQSMHQRFIAMLAQPDMDTEVDVSITEQANLLIYLDSPARESELLLREKIQALLLQLKPVAHCFVDSVRETLLHPVDRVMEGIEIIEARNISEQTLLPLSTLINAIHETLPWASLEPRVLHPLERLRNYYETAHQALITGTLEARMRWLTWKAQLSIPSVGHYLISVQAARQLLCRDELGRTVKKNNEGNHAVVFRDDLVFKPNPNIDDKADPIEPGMEHAMVAWHQLLANSPDSAASTEVIKLRQVPFKLETGATVLEGGVVQCGLMIHGILLLDMLTLQETMQRWVNGLGQVMVEALLPEVLSAIAQITVQHRQVQELARAQAQEQIEEHIQEQAQIQTQAIEEVLKAFCAYSQSLIPGQGLSGIEELLNKPHLWSDAMTYIQRKGGLPTLQLVFTWCQQYPELMRGQSVGDVLGWIEGFKVLFKLNPEGFPLAAKDQIELSLNWAKRLNPDNATAMTLISLLTYPTDGKGDNYMVTFRVDEETHLPHDFRIISIDSDRAMLSSNIPLEGISCRPGLRKNDPALYWPDLNCVFLVLKDVLSLPVSQTIVNHFMSKTPLQWVETWLGSILYKTQQWKAWQALKILLPDDIVIIKDDMQTKRLDIPVQLPVQLIDGLLSRLEKIEQSFQNPQVAAALTVPNPANPFINTLTIKDIFFALEPILAIYYETLMHQFPEQPLKAHERIHKPFDRKYDGQLEIKTLLKQQLQAPVPQLALLAEPLSQQVSSLESVLDRYQIQPNRTEPNSPIEQLANHLAAIPQGLFTPDNFTNEAQIPTTLQWLESLGRLGAAQFNLALGSLSDTVLAKVIHQTVHFACPGALRLLLLERERRLTENTESLRLRKPDELLQHLNDSEGKNLWHVLFSKLNAASYAENINTAEHITALLAQVISHQINTRDHEGHLAIFTLIRRITIVPEQAEMVLARLVTLGLDFTLTEKTTHIVQGTKVQVDETPLDHAMQMCLSRPEKPPLNAVTLLLCYGAGRAVSLSIAQAFFQQFRQQNAKQQTIHRMGVLPNLEEALHQLKQQNPVFAWQLALNTLTDPLDIGNVPQGAWLIRGTKTGKRYLAAEIVTRVKHTQAPVLPVSLIPVASTALTTSAALSTSTQLTRTEQYGRHEVLSIDYRGEQMHLKILPELPGLEYAVGSLYRHFFHYGLPETELFQFPAVNKNQPLAVLFSQTIIGENLHDVLKTKDAAAKLSQLDPARFTELLIMHLLTNPEDGKDDNYQLISFINTQGQERYAIVPIDNDHAFVDAFRMETDKTTREPIRLLQIKTIIYCLDAMNWPLDEAVIQKFISLSIAQKLTTWLTELTQTEQSFNQLFHHKKERQQLLNNTEHPVIIGVPFAPKKIAMLYDKARRVQRIFQKHLQTRHQANQPDRQMLSGLDVLKKLEPTLGHYYESAFSEADTPQSRFFYLAKDLYTVDARGQQQTMLSGIALLSTQNISESGILGQDERYSPKQALKELKQVQKEYTQLEIIRKSVQGGNIKALDALLLDKNKEKIILGLNLTQLKPKDQEALWKYLTDKKTAIAFERLKIQGTADKPITTLTDDILKKLLAQSPHLRTLQLSHCPNITEASLSELSTLCLSLMHLSLTGLLALIRLGKTKQRLGDFIRGPIFSTMQMESLQTLQLTDLAALTDMQLALPHISTFSMQGCPNVNAEQLHELLTRIDKISYLHINHSSLFPINHGQHLSRLHQWHRDNIQLFLKEGLLLKNGAFYLNPLLQIQEADQAKLIALCPGSMIQIELPGAPTPALLAACYQRPNLIQLQYQVSMWNIEAQSLTGHTGIVLSVAFSPNGRYLASGSKDNTVRLWDTGTHKTVATLSGHTKSIWNVAFSPDGLYLASGSKDKTVRLWEMATQKTVAIFTEHTSNVWSVAFSPNGCYLASGSEDKTVCLWDIATRKKLVTVIKHTAAVASVAFSPDGCYLALGSTDKIVRLWNMATHKTVTRLKDVSSVAFSPDGRYLVSKSWDDIVRLQPIARELQLDVEHIRLGLLGQWTMLGLDNVVIMQLLEELDEAELQLNAKCLAAHLQALNFESNIMEMLQKTSPHQWYWTGESHTLAALKTALLMLLPNPTVVPIIRLLLECQDQIQPQDIEELLQQPALHTLVVQQPAAAHQSPMVLNQHSTVYCIAFSPDGRYMASGSKVNTVLLWNMATQKIFATLTGHTALVWSIAFSPDSQLLASGSWDNTVRLWDVITQEEIAILTGHTYEVLSVAFSPDGCYLASGSKDATICLWEMATKKIAATLTGHTGSVFSVAFSPDGRYLASGSKDATIRLWEMATKKIAATLTGHTGSVFSVAFSPDGRYLASGGEDKTVQLCDLQSIFHNNNCIGRTDIVYSVAFSPDGRYLASGSWDNTVRLWDMATRTLQATLTGHTGSVFSVAFSPDGHYLASGSSDATVRLWAWQRPLPLLMTQLHQSPIRIIKTPRASSIQVIASMVMTTLQRLAWETQWHALLLYLGLENVTTTWQSASQSWLITTNAAQFKIVSTLLNALAQSFAVATKHGEKEINAAQPSLAQFIEDTQSLPKDILQFSYEILDTAIILHNKAKDTAHPDSVARLWCMELACCLERDWQKVCSLFETVFEIQVLEKGLKIVCTNSKQQQLLIQLLHQAGINSKDHRFKFTYNEESGYALAKATFKSEQYKEAREHFLNANSFFKALKSEKTDDANVTKRLEKIESYLLRCKQ